MRLMEGNRRLDAPRLVQHLPVHVARARSTRGQCRDTFGSGCKDARHEGREQEARRVPQIDINASSREPDDHELKSKASAGAARQIHYGAQHEYQIPHP